MRERAQRDGIDLLFVDTGDLHDGNGLSDAFPELDPSHPNYRYAVNGHVSNQVFALADYDVLTIGNHELYNYSVALDVYENFAPQCKCQLTREWALSHFKCEHHAEWRVEADWIAVRSLCDTTQRPSCSIIRRSV